MSFKKIETIEVRFSLSKEVPIQSIDSVSNIEFRLNQKNGRNHLSEIVIKMQIDNLNLAISEAITKVERLCNFISFKCRQGIIPTYRGFLVRYGDGTTSVAGEADLTVWRDNDLKLSKKEISRIEYDHKHSIYLHFSRGRIALLSYKDNAAVIRELYQILEDDNSFPPHLIKYRYLRHAVSHGSELEQNTLNNIERNFGKDYFVFTNRRFDYTSHINIRNLRIQAFNFMIEMLKKYENIC
jgi:hypothetical protein